MNIEQEGWAWPNLPKKEWGPRGWNWLHVTAINYPLSPTPVDARTALRRIWDFVTHLPCRECREHSTRFVLQNPPNLASAHALEGWVWNFHNTVNYRLGKAFVPYEEYQRIYADEICWANWSSGCGLQPGSSN
jgi:hypothetical protein